jgi:outer membrane protein assembly factor BamB/Tfp pilus assembly protein PilF
LAFKGDLKDINLADIFQTLAMNQQEGTLTITSGERHTEIYFSKEGVRLLASGNQRHIRLGELLLKRRKLTPVELDMALARQKMTGELLGQALVDMNVVTDQDIVECVRSQIEEDIYEIFSWKKARFEFAPGGPSGEFYDPAKTGKPIAFNVNAVIMEAARRIDEWSLIHRYVPSTSTIYMLKDPQAAIPDVSHLGFEGEDILQIVKSIDGRSTVDQVVAESALSSFEVCKIVAALVELGYITKLDLKETIRIADGLYREGNREGAIKIYRDALADQPRDAQLRLKLAELYENEEMKNEAAAEYAKAGQTYLESGASDDGLALYKRAIELSPKNFAIRLNLFNYYVSGQKFDLAAREGLFVAKTYWRMNRLEDARSTLDQILQMSPDNVEALQMLTSIHMDMEEPDKALERYETLARVYELRNEETRLAECYRKMLVLAPKRGDLRNKLNSLLSKQKKAKGTGNRKLAYILVVLVVVIGAAAAYYVMRELDARSKWAELKKEIDAALAAVDPGAIDEEAEKRLGELAAKAEEFRSKNSLSILVLMGGSIDSNIDRLHKRREEIEGNRTRKYEDEVKNNDRIYTNARLKEQEGEFLQALDLYRKVNRKLQPQNIATGIETKIRYLSQYLADAERLHKEIRGLVDAGKWEPAYEKLLELMSDYANSKEAEGVKLPLVIESVPGGAEVKIGGLVVGKTPYVYMREPGQTFEVSVSKKPGYRDPLEQLVDDLNWKVSFTLAKEPVWEYQAVGKIEDAPVADKERAYFTTREGVAYALDLRDGKRSWQFALESPVGRQFLVSPTLAEGKIYAGAASGHIHVLDAKKGKKLWESGKTAAGIRGASRMLSDAGVIYVGCVGGVYGVDVKRQAVVEDKFKTDKPVWSNPAYRNEIVYVGSNDAKLYAIGAGTLQEIWSFKTLGAVMTEPVFYTDVNAGRDFVIIGSSDKAVYAFHAAPRLPKGVDRLVWRFLTKGEVTVSQAVAGGCVYAASSDGNLYCINAADGTQKWVFETEADAVASPLVVDGVVYFGTTDKFFYAVSADTGEELWRYATSGEIRGGACVSGGLVEIQNSLHKLVIVGAADGTIYCFTTD